MELDNSQWEKLQQNAQNEATVFVDTQDLNRYPIPRLIDKFLKENRGIISSGG
jgi:hypothetical protein